MLLKIIKDNDLLSRKMVMKMKTTAMRNWYSKEDNNCGKIKIHQAQILCLSKILNPQKIEAVDIIRKLLKVARKVPERTT